MTDVPRIRVIPGHGWLHRSGSIVLYSARPWNDHWTEEVQSMEVLVDLCREHGQAAVMSLDSRSWFATSGVRVLADGSDRVLGDDMSGPAAMASGPFGFGDPGCDLVSADHSYLGSGTVPAGGVFMDLPEHREQRIVVEGTITVGHTASVEDLDPLGHLPRPYRLAGESPRKRTSLRRNAQRFLVQFDDGQTIEVQRGILVGRNPTKKGLPRGFSAATVVGEHVSRVHWQARRDGRRILIGDAGSGEGTHVRLTDGRLRSVVVGEELAVEPGSQVFFADRWAVVLDP